MAELRFVEGDATVPIGDGPRILVHIVNTLGIWGAGFVMAVSERWPPVRVEYRSWYRGRNRGANNFHLGGVLLMQVEPQLWVANCVAQQGIAIPNGRPPIRYVALGRTLDKVRTFAEKQGASVHMPRIGTGLAGGRWDRVEVVVRMELVDRGIDVVVYDLGRSAPSG